ncbi:MAG: asparagine synthase (glutamine-hydrolyzing) [Bryobacteraceae bacterium]
MCGIFGVVETQGQGVDPNLLWAGTHAVRHRGPNDWGFVSLLPVGARSEPSFPWRGAEDRDRARGYRIGLGNRRLSILDLSEAGHLPMNLPGTELWIAFNGEIYNYLELREELSADRQFTTGSDTEVLLAAFSKWGIECLTRLNGMFAFALWDGSRKRLFLARDRFGEKPLYYAQVNGRLIFGSELKQFLKDPEFDREPDQGSLADFLLFSVQDHDERTFLRQARQLLPAHWMEIDARSGTLSSPRCYWKPELADDLDTSNDRDFPEKLKYLLGDSTRLRLRSDVRVGVCLSGGLDSTTICSLMASQVPEPSILTGYTISFPGYAEDETALATQAAARSGVGHQVSTFGAGALWDEIQHFIYHQDGPTGGAPNFASWRVFQDARANGTVVLLNGQGGDELLGGYNKFFFFWFQILLARGRWARLARDAGTYFKVHGLDRWSFALGRRYFPLFMRKKLMGMWQFSRPGFRRHATTKMDWGSGKSLNQRLWRDLSRFSLPCLLHWEDRNSMAIGTEARLPFLDHRIAEAVLATSAYTKLNCGFSKYSLRKAMDDSLPSEVCWQKKKRGFETPADDWFREDLALEMRQVLSPRTSPLNELFNTPDLLENFEGFVRGDPDTLTQFDWFKLMGTAIWLEQLTSSRQAEEYISDTAHV